MGMDLYYIQPSAPCRAVLMLGKELGVEFNLKVVNILNGEQMKPEYLAINPEHTVPTLVDDGFILWESRAILQYLCNKFGSDLYPKDAKKRATVDRFLFFDSGTLSSAMRAYIMPQIFAKQPPDEEKNKTFQKSLTLLNTFLEGHTFVAGDAMTIADLSLFSSLTFIETMGDYDFGEWPNVAQWMSKLKKELPYHNEINEEPLKGLKEHFSNK